MVDNRHPVENFSRQANASETDHERALINHVRDLFGKGGNDSVSANGRYEQKHNDIVADIKSGDPAKIKADLEKYKDNPRALFAKMPELEKALKENGITVTYKIETLLGDYQGRNPYGNLTLRKGETQVSFLTNGLAPQVFTVTENPNGSRSMRVPRDNDPKQALDKMLGKGTDRR